MSLFPVNDEEKQAGNHARSANYSDVVKMKSGVTTKKEKEKY